MAYDFSAVCESGQTLYYNITSSTEPYTVAVASHSDNIVGDLIIPEYVTYNGITYSVTKVTLGAFSGCSGLTSVTIPNSVTFIGARAFVDCSGITTVNFNATNCTSMGSEYSPFEGCDAFTTLNIGENVTNIPSYAFKDCSSLTGTLTIPNSVTYIGAYAFKNCSGLTEVIVDGSIGSSAFSGCSSMISLTIGQSVTSIGSYAFEGCVSLTTVNFNATNCTTMGGSIPNHVFIGCSSLTTLNIGNDVTNIPKYAFKDCNTLTGTLTIPNSVTNIDISAFSGCSSLNTLSIGESVTTIAGNAFKDCSGLAIVNFNAINCTTMGNSSNTVFSGCTSLTTLNIGPNVTNIPDKAFKGCSSLTGALTIPNSVTNICSEAFHTCHFTSVTISNSVTSIGDNAFGGCSGLSAVYYTGTIAQWCNITFSGTTLTTVTSNPLVIAHNLYINNSLVTDLVIPNTVTEIKQNAFIGASCLTSVTIGNSVTGIGSFAFYSCSGLTSITSLATNPPTLYSVPFWLVNADIPVYVPCGCVSAYNNANGWNYFTNIQQNPDCPTDIEENIIEKLELYPNPVGNILNITSLETISEIEIVNVMGQVLKRIEVNSDNAVCDVEDLKAGVYVVRIHAASATLSQRKFVKK